MKGARSAAIPRLAAGAAGTGEGETRTVAAATDKWVAITAVDAAARAERRGVGMRTRAGMGETPTAA